APDHQQLVALRHTLRETFSLDELQTLCFTLNIPYEDLPGDSHTGKVEEIVGYMQRRQQLAALVAYGRQQRPQAAWPQITPPDIPVRNDIAIVVSIAQPALTTVADYLDEEDIPAHFVLLTNVPGYDHTEFLGLDDDWDAVAKLFYQTTQSIRLQFPQARLHLFLAAPLSLCFLLGCTWGTVYQGDYLYHLHHDKDGRSRYVRVAVITRQLRET
ncbi:MAG: SAVED domain-containing protein, partial [Candidatus Thermofonsia bacterium]